MCIKENSDLEWNYIASVNKVEPVNIPSSAKWIRVEMFVQPVQSSAVLSFDFEFSKSLNGYRSLFKTRGFYYNTTYYGSVSLYVTSDYVRIAYGGEWTRVCYGGTVYNPEDMYSCTTVVYYR